MRLSAIVTCMREFYEYLNLYLHASLILKKLSHLSSYFEEEREMFYEHQVCGKLELILILDKALIL